MRISDWSSDVCSSDLLTAQEAWLGRAINISVNQPYLHSEAFERNGKIRRQSRYPDPTLAAANGEQAQHLLFRRTGVAKVGHVLEHIKLAPNHCFKNTTLDLPQPVDTHDENPNTTLPPPPT